MDQNKNLQNIKKRMKETEEKYYELEDVIKPTRIQYIIECINKKRDGDALVELTQEEYELYLQNEDLYNEMQEIIWDLKHLAQDLYEDLEDLNSKELDRLVNIIYEGYIKSNLPHQIDNDNGSKQVALFKILCFLMNYLEMPKERTIFYV